MSTFDRKKRKAVYFIGIRGKMVIYVFSGRSGARKGKQFVVFCTTKVLEEHVTRISV